MLRDTQGFGTRQPRCAGTWKVEMLRAREIPQGETVTQFLKTVLLMMRASDPQTASHIILGPRKKHLLWSLGPSVPYKQGRWAL